ncbi:MAG TPA: glycosyltransferase [Nitrososphaera sp.]|nr:glycosyltransferase [Nitrososphaera sp.]
MNVSEFFTMFAVHIALVIFCAGFLVIGAVSLRHGRKPVPIPQSRGHYFPFISIVIPTYNEEAIIASRLDSMVRARYPADKMEIVIVDSSSDGTPSILDSYSRKYPFIKIIHDEERRGLATALNQAFRACKGEIVVKSDSDLTLAEDTLVNIVSHFSDPHIGAVTGRVNVANNSGASNEVQYRGLHELIQQAESEVDSVFMAHTFSAYRRHLMKEYKQKEYGDETIQTLHIRKQGYRVVYDPNVRFYEDYPEDGKERLRQKIRRSEGLTRVLLENRDVLFNAKYGRFGKYVFPANFFMFILSPVLLMATPVVAAVDLAFFSLATYLDILILALFGIIVAARKTPRLSSVWTFLELQYAQFRALVNVTIMKRRDYKWKKIERVAPRSG